MLELDELWSYVQKKSNKQWIWIALCRRTKQVVAYAVGPRDEKTCQRLWKNIPEQYQHCFCYSDFWKAYQKVVPKTQHQAVGKETGQTNHVERWNNTLRQRSGRFTRKTLSFSKKLEWHQWVLKLFIWNYNKKVII